MTSTSISSGVGDPGSSQQMEHQKQEEDLIEPPTTSGSISREVRHTLREVEEFVEATRTDMRERRHIDTYQALVA